MRQQIINSMVIVTYIYSDNVRTKQTIDSFKRFGYEVAIVREDAHRGNGHALRLLYECYKRASTGHINFAYADAADSFCQRTFFAPYDKIIYSTEKACYPHVELAKEYPTVKTKYIGSPWKYLNGGGYCGSTKLIVEFFEKYLLKHLTKNDVNGQHEQALAYIEAQKDGFPIQLDDGCELFQTMAFADPSEFEVRLMQSQKVVEEQTKILMNVKTKNIPAILHFNGLTDMSILKELK